LKLLSAIRVGQKQKKIDINIPKLDDFIHKIYTNVARKVYKAVYLFEVHIEPLQVQKNNREIDLIVQECILNTVRDSIPVEAILQAYMDETVEETHTEEVKEEIIDVLPPKGKTVVVDEDIPLPLPLASQNSVGQQKSLTFDDTDYTRDQNDVNKEVVALKDVATLEEISVRRNSERAAATDDDDDDDQVKIKIFDTAPAVPYAFDIETMDPPTLSNLNTNLILNDIEELV